MNQKLIMVFATYKNTDALVSLSQCKANLHIPLIQDVNFLLYFFLCLFHNFKYTFVQCQETNKKKLTIEIIRPVYYLTLKIFKH